jgi:hypothetical protein
VGCDLTMVVPALLSRYFNSQHERPHLIPKKRRDKRHVCLNPETKPCIFDESAAIAFSNYFSTQIQTNNVFLQLSQRIYHHARSNRQRSISRQTTPPLHLDPRRSVNNQSRQGTRSALQPQHESLAMLLCPLVRKTTHGSHDRGKCSLKEEDWKNAHERKKENIPHPPKTAPYAYDPSDTPYPPPLFQATVGLVRRSFHVARNRRVTLGRRVREPIAYAGC